MFSYQTLLRRITFGAGLLLCLSPTAYSQTFAAELKKVDTLRRVFGDQIVNSLTSLPPNQYKAARDEALALATKAGDNVFAQDDAKAKLCAEYAKLGYACHDVVETAEETAPDQNAPDSASPSGSESVAVSGVSKQSQADPVEPVAGALAAEGEGMQAAADVSTADGAATAATAASSAAAAATAEAASQDPDPTLAADRPELRGEPSKPTAHGVRQAESDPDDQELAPDEEPVEANPRSAKAAAHEEEEQPMLSEFATQKQADEPDPELDGNDKAAPTQAQAPAPAARQAPRRRVSSESYEPVEGNEVTIPDQGPTAEAAPPAERVDPRDPVL